MEYSRLTVQALCAGDRHPFSGPNETKITAGDVREALRRGANKPILMAILYSHNYSLIGLIPTGRQDPVPRIRDEDIYIE